jgi:hypothetical protein
MDIEIKEVQEIIKNLESSGELSIKEEKYLNVAKLCVHLAAENVALKACVLEAFEEMESHHDTNGLYSYDADGEQMDALIRLCDAQGTISDLLSMLETTSTDLIVAGIKADGVEQAANECYGAGYICETLLAYAKQLREGATNEPRYRCTSH